MHAYVYSHLPHTRTHPPLHTHFIFYFVTNCQHPETEFITVCCPGMCYKQLQFVDALKNITSNPQVAASQKRSSQFRDSYVKSKATNISTPVFSSSMVLDLRFTQTTTREENNKGIYLWMVLFNLVCCLGGISLCHANDHFHTLIKYC